MALIDVAIIFTGLGNDQAGLAVRRLLEQFPDFQSNRLKFKSEIDSRCTFLLPPGRIAAKKRKAAVRSDKITAVRILRQSVRYDSKSWPLRVWLGPRPTPKMARFPEVGAAWFYHAVGSGVFLQSVRDLTKQQGGHHAHCDLFLSPTSALAEATRASASNLAWSFFNNSSSLTSSSSNLRRLKAGSSSSPHRVSDCRRSWDCNSICFGRSACQTIGMRGCL